MGALSFILPIASALIIGFVTFLFTKRKYSVEVESSEFDLTKKLNDYYKNEAGELLQSVEKLTKKVEELEILVRQLVDYECTKVECKNRQKRN